MTESTLGETDPEQVARIERGDKLKVLLSSGSDTGDLIEVAIAERKREIERAKLVVNQ